MSSKTQSFGSRRDADIAQRRGVAVSDVDWSEEDASPSSVPVPSTSGVKIREETTLIKPVRVVLARASVNPKQVEKEDNVLIVDDEDRDSDTGVDEDGSVEMEEKKEKEEDSESDPVVEPPAKIPRKRGRPAINPDHEGQFTGEKLAARALAKKERKIEQEQMAALDPATEIRRGPRLKKARREELELLLEFKETSTAGLSTIINEQVTTLRKVAQGCSNLSGRTIKALWDTTVSIAAATAALNMRATSSGRAVASPEWEDLREELRQLRVDLAHLRATNETLKEDLRKGRAEQERLGKELEKEKEERRRDRERDRERERREEERERRSPPRRQPRTMPAPPDYALGPRDGLLWTAKRRRWTWWERWRRSSPVYPLLLCRIAGPSLERLSLRLSAPLSRE